MRRLQFSVLAFAAFASAMSAHAQTPVPCAECKTSIDIDAFKWACMKPKVFGADTAPSDPFPVVIPKEGCAVSASLGDPDFFTRVRVEVQYLRISEAKCLKKLSGEIDAGIKTRKTVVVDLASCKVS